MSLTVYDRVYHDTPYRLEFYSEEDRFSLTAESTDTGETWKGEFTARFIEEITSKTGNAKKFSVFEKMLVKGLEGGSASVVVDLLSAQELDQLRNRKPGKAGQFSSRVGSRKYFILTYSVEFDKVHYPLPLLQEEMVSDPGQLRSTIKRLREELRDLRSSLAKGDSQSLIEENLRLRARVRESEDREIAFEQLQRAHEDLKEELSAERANSTQKIRQLQSVNIRLQEELDHVKEEMDGIIQQMEEDQRLRTNLPDTKTLLAMAQDYQTLRRTVTEQREALHKCKAMLETQARRSNSVPKGGAMKSALLSPLVSEERKVKCTTLEDTVTKLNRIILDMKS